MGLTRREWLKATLAVAGVGVLVAACGDDDDKPTPDQGPRADTGPSTDSASQDTMASDTAAQDCSDSNISSNHNHALVVPAADVAAGAEKTYSIEGTASHAHEITISAADFTTLQGGQSVTVTSTNVSGHTHEVTISCA